MRLFGKKGEAVDAGEDQNRLALFGSRSKSKSPTPSGNPYAQSAPAQSGNPYGNAPASSGNPYANAPADPYAQAKQKAYGDTSDSYPAGGAQGVYGQDNKSNLYGDNKSAGYSASKYGTQGGYGSDRFGSTNQSRGGGGGGGSRYGSGGYGGFGGDSFVSQQDDANRDALFRGAQERAQEKKQDYAGSGPPSYSSGGGGAAGGLRGGPGSNYGGSGYNTGSTYQDRQLTAEEEEEEEVKATKQQIRFVKQSDVASTRNALRIAQQAEEVGRDTLARLGAQGEHLHNTEKNLDLAHNQNKIAEEKARELKTLNRSMFAVHVSNPFTAKARDAARDEEVKAKHLEERAEREATRRAGYLAEQRMMKNFNDLSVTGEGKKQRNLAERAKYQFEADSEDEEMENEIDDNLDALSGVTGRLNALARATGREVDEQNERLKIIEGKSDKVDIGIASNRAKLDRIK